MTPEATAHAIRAAIFDFGGVMTEPVFRPTGHEDPEVLALLGHFLREARDVYALPTGDHDIHQLETGRIDEAEFFARMCRRYEEETGRHIDPEEARRHIFGRPLAASAAMVEAVAQVRSAGFRTAMLTNVSSDGYSLWQDILDVESLFDVVVDSSVVGLRKPDPAIFRLTCERLGVTPGECLFVDDIPSNVEGAAALGIEALLCADPVATADEVVRRLLGRPLGEAPGTS